MKSLITFLFIIVASTTYRCGKEEETIDCVSLTAQMIGTWDGTISYTQPDNGIMTIASPLTIAAGTLSYHEVQTAVGDTHDFIMNITEVDQCVFIGTIEFGEIDNSLNEVIGNVSYKVNGTIDKYGWVSFVETEFIERGSTEQQCTWGETIQLAQECQNWPRGRFRRSGGIYNEGRFTSDPILEWSGEYNLPNSAYGQGTWTSSGYQSVQVNNIAGGYKLTKR